MHKPDDRQLQRAIELLPPLHDLPAALRVRLQTESQLLHLPAGYTLFHEQAACAAFPLVLEGSIRVSKCSAQGREILLYRVSPGESCVLTCGCLLGELSYAALGVTETAVEMIAMPRPLFDALISGHSPFRRYVFSLFATRLSELMLIIEDVAFHRLDQRLAAWLLAKGPDIRATHQAIADELGSVREMVSRLLGHFADRGLVQPGREHITVIDAAALQALASQK